MNLHKYLRARIHCMYFSSAHLDNNQTDNGYNDRYEHAALDLASGTNEHSRALGGDWYRGGRANWGTLGLHRRVNSCGGGSSWGRGASSKTGSRCTGGNIHLRNCDDGVDH